MTFKGHYDEARTMVLRAHALRPDDARIEDALLVITIQSAFQMAQRGAHTAALDRLDSLYFVLPISYALYGWLLIAAPSS